MNSNLTQASSREVVYTAGSKTIIIPETDYVPILMRARATALKFSTGDHDKFLRDLHIRKQRGILEWANAHGQMQSSE